jgi:hypothetical protein
LDFDQQLAYNGLQLPDGFYFGLSWHCLIVKNIAIKLEKFFTEIHIAIFSLQKFQYELQNLIYLLSAQNKIYLVGAVIS